MYRLARRPHEPKEIVQPYLEQLQVVSINNIYKLKNYINISIKMKKKRFYYVGNKSDMKLDLKQKRRAEFVSHDAMIKEYGSLQGMQRVHGKRYVQRILLPVNYFKGRK